MTPIQGHETESSRTQWGPTGRPQRGMAQKSRNRGLPFDKHRLLFAFYQEGGSFSPAYTFEVETTVLEALEKKKVSEYNASSKLIFN